VFQTPGRSHGASLSVRQTAGLVVYVFDIFVSLLCAGCNNLHHANRALHPPHKGHALPPAAVSCCLLRRLRGGRHAQAVCRISMLLSSIACRVSDMQLSFCRHASLLACRLWVASPHISTALCAVCLTWSCLSVASHSLPHSLPAGYGRTTRSTPCRACSRRACYTSRCCFLLLAVLAAGWRDA
jgi:hypothetical protein